jgi:pyruvate/2-oxoacid:ferredoxin oxidoreductase alpha subunit
MSLPTLDAPPADAPGPTAPVGPRRVLLTGNHAVAWAARLARPQVAPVYPITPQTPILELLTEFQAAGEFDAEVLTPESEHSVLAACIPASLAGARVFTATASQGLLLMHELLHYAAGARAPIVMANVNRTVASPWAFWPDQTDSLAQRDTGWLQYYVESPQEALDTVLQAFRVAEQVRLPAMINLDAFYVSHALEPVELPPPQWVERLLPRYAPAQRLDTDHPSGWGNVVSPQMYMQHRRDIEDAMTEALQVARQADLEWQSLSGRGWGIVESYRCEGAQTLVVALGSLCGSVREAVDQLRERGHEVGLVKLRLLRPLPLAALRAALEGARDVLVLDRDHSPGLGGVLHQEVRSALYGLPRPPRVHGRLAGVGGVNMPPERICALVAQAVASEPRPESVWMECP